ncbi:MAG: protein kinase [Anaerolineales bacterium]|jgi:serine/threonine protein kinase/Tol biopolymer transport system component
MTLDKDSLLNERYRILEILGQGGMGAVYHARDENLGLDVAVKENLFTSEEYSRQFRREAVILATMRHPNLPRVIDHFEIANQGQYMVMDFIEGEDLRQRMDRVGSLPDEEVIIIGAAICDALEYLHTRKPIILHRDIKPGNIKVNPDGQVYLVDFGLAKIVSGSQITTTGARAMTPGYSSPEQYGTARTDERSDIYSLGATLYAALTNTIPEDGLARAMDQSDLTPIRKRNPKVSRKVASSVEKALEVHPEDRYQKANEFKVALLQSSNSTKQIDRAEELTVIPPPPEVIAEVNAGKRMDAKGAMEPEISGSSSTRRRRIFWRRFRRTMLVLLTVIFMAALAWTAVGMPGRESLNNVFPASVLNWVFDYTPTPTKVTPTATELIPSRTPVHTATASLTPTATRTPRPTSTPTVTQTPTITMTPTPIRVPAQPSPTPLPDDYEEPLEEEQLAFASLRSGSAQIWLYSFEEGSLEQLTELPFGACQPSWSPDGRLLAFISPCTRNQRIYTNTFIFVLDMETEEIIQLAVDEGSFDPAWSPDGASMLFTNADSPNVSGIYRINTEDSQVVLMHKNEKLSFNPEWSPDGERFVFASNPQPHYFLYIMENDPLSIPEVFARTLEKIYLKPTWSVREQLIYSRGPLLENDIFSMWTMPASMLGASDLIYEEIRLNQESGRQPEMDPDFNFSGNWVAYESWPDGANHDIFIARQDGGMIVRITQHDQRDFDPAWRPYPRP